jgi:hypothetical protein
MLLTVTFNPDGIAPCAVTITPYTPPSTFTYGAAANSRSC